jgi:hypothetical protein
LTAILGGKRRDLIHRGGSAFPDEIGDNLRSIGRQIKRPPKS